MAEQEDNVEGFMVESDSDSNYLAGYVQKKFEDVESSRRDEEERWLDAYRQYRGLYGPETQFTSTEKSQSILKLQKQSPCGFRTNYRRLFCRTKISKFGIEPPIPKA
ncbi:MAG: hypothetical protein CM15mL2_0010 [Caudoviricetes sp.]|nr:MAG: hypothetical protein CM15mL2_0010 [Caudoviricetes sp.]